MRVVSCALLALALAGCQSHELTVPDQPCETTIDQTVPLQGAVDAYVRSDIVFELSDPDPSATIGMSVPGSVVPSRDDEQVTFHPDEPLQPSSGYTATFDYCGGSAELLFLTSSVGAPFSGPVTDLVGTTWFLDASSGRITEPYGLDSVVSSALPDLLLGVSAADDTSLTVLYALADAESSAPAQDACTATVTMGPVDFASAPFFRATATSLPLNGYYGVMTLEDATLEATFAPDQVSLVGMLSGQLDIRRIPPIRGEPICDVMDRDFGTPCQACPSDSQPYCLPFRWEEVPGEPVDGLPLTETDGACAR